MQEEMAGREILDRRGWVRRLIRARDGGRRCADGQVELEQLKGERDQLMDRLARLQAEFDNARKREAKERADARDYAVSSAVEPFLSVMDNFQLALKADGTKEQLRAGVELILKQMEEALKGLNVHRWSRWGRSLTPESTRHWGASKLRSFRTIRCWRRFGGGIRSARSCCGRRWSGLRRIRGRCRIRG